jgi:tetratricopeptide (TPR) repeat protein
MLMYGGRVDEAVKEFDAAIQLDPNFPQAYYGAYYALMQAGRRERALGYLREMARLSPDDPGIQKLLRSQGGTPEPNPGAPPRPPVPNIP